MAVGFGIVQQLAGDVAAKGRGQPLRFEQQLKLDRLAAKLAGDNVVQQGVGSQVFEFQLLGSWANQELAVHVAGVFVLDLAAPFFAVAGDGRLVCLDEQATGALELDGDRERFFLQRSVLPELEHDRSLVGIRFGLAIGLEQPPEHLGCGKRCGYIGRPISGSGDFRPRGHRLVTTAAATGGESQSPDQCEFPLDADANHRPPSVVYLDPAPIRKPQSSPR